jgi:hypothetical protein
VPLAVRVPSGENVDMASELPEPTSGRGERRVPNYEETGSLTIRIELTALFDEAYEGDEDGYVWLERWRRTVQPRVVRAVFDALRSDPAFDVIPVSRGRAPDENVEVDVRLRGAGRGPT